MKKIFISQPMNGKTDEEMKSERQRVITIMGSYLEDKVKVIDPTVQSPPEKAKPLWFLGKALEALSTADVAVFAKGWEKYRGCRIEHTCAIEYGIRIVEL